MICGQPVTVPGVFSAVSTDTGHRCQRESGHEGVHRWQARWEGVSTAEVEAEIARDLATWEGEEAEDVEE